MVTVALGDQAESLVRKRTVGILDMGGASLQIAYEVPSSGAFSSPQQVRTRPGDGASSKPRAVADRCPLLPQEEAAKSLLAEFNLGCDVQHSGHVYRVYVNTFLGFGGNFARQRYEELVLNQTHAHSRYCCCAWRRPVVKQPPGPSRRSLPLGFAPGAACGDNGCHGHAGSSGVPAARAWASRGARALPSEPGRFISATACCLPLLQQGFPQHVVPSRPHLQLSPHLSFLASSPGCTASRRG